MVAFLPPLSRPHPPHPERKFKRGDKGTYSLAEKDKLGKLCITYKEEYDMKIYENKNTINFNQRRKNAHQNDQDKDMLLVQFESITQT